MSQTKRLKITWKGVKNYFDGTAEVIGKTSEGRVQVRWPFGSGGVVAIPAANIVEVVDVDV